MPSGAHLIASHNAAEGTGGARDDAQRAAPFRQSSLAWNAHWPTDFVSTTSTTTSTTTYTTTQSAASSNSSAAHPVETDLPPWLQRLPKGMMRGDNCFRELFGEHASLLDDEGRMATRFTRSQCPPHLRHAAEGLAATMQARNEANEDVWRAGSALVSAEAELQSAKTARDIAQADAEHQGTALGRTRIKPFNARVHAAGLRVDDAKKRCAEETKVLQAIQRDLELRHEAAQQLLQEPAPIPATAAQETLDGDSEEASDDEGSALPLAIGNVLSRRMTTIAGGLMGGSFIAMSRQVGISLAMLALTEGPPNTPAEQMRYRELEAVWGDPRTVAGDALAGFVVGAALMWLWQRQHDHEMHRL